MQRRKSRVRLGSRGNTARESRVSQRYNARLPTPLRAWSSPKVTTSLGQRRTSGCLGVARSWSSTSENKAVIKSTVVIRLSSQNRDCTHISVEESSDGCKLKNVHQ